MKKMIFSIIFFLTVVVSQAAAVKFEATISHDVVEVGQRFQISFTINASASNFSPPDLSNFRLLGGPNQSRSIQIINGQRAATVSLSYILMAVKEGDFEIGPASIQVGNDILKSNPLQLKVVQSSPNSANAQRNRQNQRQADGQQISDDVYIRAIVDKTKAYVGEKITATYRLYTSVGIAENTLEELPDLNGFWSQDVKSLYDQTNWQEEIINGKRYNVAELQQTLLYPQRSGTLTIDPIEMKMKVHVQGSSGNSLFDRMFGNYETKEVIIKSNPVNIEVTPLPNKGKPSNFSGAVGSFNMDVQVNKNAVKANEAIHLKIQISGNGNPQLISAPELNLPPDFEVYEPETIDQFNTNATGISGKRTFDYLIIPRHEGTYVIDPYHFNYFDLSSKTYKSIVSDSITIQVAPGPVNANQTYTSINKEDVEMINKDIRYIHEDDTDLQTKKAKFYGSLLFYLLILLPILLFFLLIYAKRKYDEKKTDVAGLRSSKARKLAKKRLTTAKKHLDEGDKTSFYEEISAAIYGYYSDKFNLSLAELSQEKISQTIAESGASIELITLLQDVLHDAEMARFAPVSDYDDVGIYDKATKLIIKTEEDLS